MSDLSFDEVMASGDPDAIDEFVNQLDSSEEQDVITASSGGNDESLQQPSATPNTQEPEAKPVESDAPQGGANDKNEYAGVATKDGKHVIPFDVLEASRSETGVYKNKANELHQTTLQQSQELEQQKQQIALLQQQLESANLTPEKLPQDIDLDSLGEEYGDIGKVVGHLAKSLKEQQQAAPPSESQALDPELDKAAFMHAYENNTELQTLMEIPEAKPVLAELDSELQADPAFQNVPHSVRLAMVVKRYQEKVAEAARDIQQPAAPNSLSNLPGEEHKEKSGFEELESYSSEALTAHFMDMSEEELEKYL